MNFKKLLNRAEYTSLGFSAVGSAIAAVTGQAFYAVTPITIALSLNLVNRQELIKRTQQNRNNINHLEQNFFSNINSLSNNIQSIQNHLKTLPSSEEKINLNNLEKIILEIQQTTIQLKEKVNEVELSFNNLTVEREYTNRTQIENEIASLIQRFNNLNEQFNNRIERKEIEEIKDKLTCMVTSQEFNQISEQVKALASTSNFSSLEEQLNPRVLELRINVIKRQLEELVKIEYLERELQRFSDNLTSQIDINIKQNIHSFNQLIKETKPAYKYELVFDRDGSRQVLLEALETAQSRIILVCPWITYYGANDQVIRYCRAFLAQGGIIDFGWGHLKDIKQTEHISISRDKFLRIAKTNGNDWAYNQLEKFIELENQYPNRMNLKLLGTHEKFLVCDRSFAMIGSHNFLTSNCNSQEREIGLKTNDLNIIEGLISRFENAPSLDQLEKEILNN